MHRLIYTSWSVGVAGDAEIAAIIQQSCKNNPVVGVTGMLWSDGSRFAQVLEGDDDAVIDTMKRIEKDPRHRDLQTVFNRTVTQRLFGHWSMARPDANPESLANTAFLVGIGLADDSKSARRLYEIVLASADQL